MKLTALRFLRSIFVVGLFIMAVTAPVAVNQLEAQTTRSGHEIDYYSDATFTKMVGFVVFCKSGQTIRSGQMTAFSKVITEDFC